MICDGAPRRRIYDTRPLLSGWLILYRGGGGWVRGQKKVCVPKIDLQVRAPLIHFIFFLRKNFLMWVGGWVGQAKSRGANLTPPPPVSLESDGPMSAPTTGTRNRGCPSRGRCYPDGADAPLPYQVCTSMQTLHPGRYRTRVPQTNRTVKHWLNSVAGRGFSAFLCH